MSKNLLIITNEGNHTVYRLAQRLHSEVNLYFLICQEDKVKSAFMRDVKSESLLKTIDEVESKSFPVLMMPTN